MLIRPLVTRIGEKIIFFFFNVYMMIYAKHRPYTVKNLYPRNREGLSSKTWYEIIYPYPYFSDPILNIYNIYKPNESDVCLCTLTIFFSLEKYALLVSGSNGPRELSESEIPTVYTLLYGQYILRIYA